MKRRCSSFSRNSTRAEGEEAVMEGEVAAAATVYPWVATVAAAAAAAAAAMMARRSSTPRINGLPSPPPAGGPPHPPVTSLGPELPPCVPPPDPVPEPPGPGSRVPGPGPPLPVLVNHIPGAPSELRALEVARPGSPLVSSVVVVAPKGWARRLRAALPVPAPRPGMWKAPLPLPPTTVHAMVVCLAGWGPAPVLGLCETFCGSYALAPA